MTSTTPLPLPDGLADATPGPELAVALAGLPPARVAGRDLAALMRAWSRQLNHTTAGLLHAVQQAGLAVEPEGCARTGVDDGFGSEEARAALVWSRAASRRRFRLADDLIRRLPAVFLAMQSGRLDEARARAFADGTRGLEADLVDEVLARLLPIAPTLLLGALVHRIQQIVLALDPDHARRREEQAEADRRVEATRNGSGTADLCGRDLPLERVVTAAARIERLAATVKARGADLTIDQLRADMFTGLLDGLFEGLDDAAVVDLVLAQYGTDEATPTDSDDDPPADGGGDGDGDGGPDGPEDDPNDPDGPRPPAPGAPGRGLHRPRGLVRGELTTLLGLDDRPGELCGWGPLHPDRLRGLVGAHSAGRWTVVVTDADGRPVLADATRRRPRGVRRGQGWLDVEILVPAALLATLDVGRHPPWANLVEEVRDRVDALSLDPGVPVAESEVRSIRDLRRRFARAATARAVRARNRTCVFPGCRAPAHTAQLDHTLDHGLGGLTDEANLGPLCAFHHALKSAGGWELRQDRPGDFTWTSRAGAVHRTRSGPVIDPLPGPAPRRDGAPRRVRETGIAHPDDGGVPGGRLSSVWTDHRDPVDGVRVVAPHPVPAVPADAPAPF